MLVMGFPLIYKQAPALLGDLGNHVRQFGRRPLVVMDDFVNTRHGEKILRSLGAAGIEPQLSIFAGEVCAEEMEKQAKNASALGCDFVIGVGGGKVQDTAKSVKHKLGIPVVLVPTVASNDAATSRLIITYSRTGEFIGPVTLPFNPDAVLVDTEVIADAPPRFLVAGIGDALATFYEAEQCRLSGASNFFGGRPTEAACALAALCKDLILRHAEEAVESVKKKTVTEALSKVVEANVLLSGLGFEGCGVAAAHAVSQGFTYIPQLHGHLHGEEVAVGLAAQWFLERRDRTMMLSMLAFFDAIGLPFCLADLGLENPTQKELETISSFACREKSRIHNMSFKVRPEDVVSALKDANELAEKARKERT